MKKYIISISLMAIITGVLLISCQKETVLETVQQTKSADQLLEERILSFEKITANPLKSGAAIELDSALWYAEALLNYSNSEPYDSLGAIAFTIDSISFQCNGNQLTQTEVADIYTLLNQSVSSAATDENIFVFADVELLRDDLKSDGNTVVITSGFTTISTSFGVDDWWISNGTGGRCGEYSGGEGKNAADIIAQMANLRRGSVTGGHYGVYFTDVDDLDIEPFGTTPPPPDPNPFGYGDDYLFYNTTLTCLSPTAMEYYTQGLVTHTEINKIENKTLISYELEARMYLGLYGPYMHVNRSKFGISHLITVED